MQSELWSRAIGAFAAISAGALLIVFRVSISRWMADTQKAFLGKAGHAAARNASPRTTAFIGIGGIALGFIIFGQGVASLSESEGSTLGDGRDEVAGDALVAQLMFVLGAIWVVAGILTLVFRTAILVVVNRRYASVERAAQHGSMAAPSQSHQRSSKVVLTVIATVALVFGLAAITIGASMLNGEVQAMQPWLCSCVAAAVAQ